jgi:hypothetical protein
MVGGIDGYRAEAKTMVDLVYKSPKEDAFIQGRKGMYSSICLLPCHPPASQFIQTTGCERNRQGLAHYISLTQASMRLAW